MGVKFPGKKRYVTEGITLKILVNYFKQLTTIQYCNLPFTPNLKQISDLGLFVMLHELCVTHLLKM